MRAPVHALEDPARVRSGKKRRLAAEVDGETRDERVCQPVAGFPPLCSSVDALEHTPIGARVERGARPRVDRDRRDKGFSKPAADTRPAPFTRQAAQQASRVGSHVQRCRRSRVDRQGTDKVSGEPQRQRRPRFAAVSADEEVAGGRSVDARRVRGVNHHGGDQAAFLNAGPLPLREIVRSRQTRDPHCRQDDGH